MEVTVRLCSRFPVARTQVHAKNAGNATGVGMVSTVHILVEPL